MTSKIKFVRASLTKASYPTTFLNKTRKVSLNRANEPETFILATKDTPIECITAEQDFNYFLAKGGRKTIEVDNCQLGFPFSLYPASTTFCCHKGDLSYSIKPGLVTRSGGEFYLTFTPVIQPVSIFSSSPNTLEDSAELQAISLYFSSSSSLEDSIGSPVPDIPQALTISLSSYISSEGSPSTIEVQAVTVEFSSPDGLEGDETPIEIQEVTVGFSSPDSLEG